MTGVRRCRAYIAPQLLPGDRRDWKAAGVLAYTVDEVGVHLLLGRIDQRSPYAPARPRENGWWILGAPDLASRFLLPCKCMMHPNEP